MFPSIVSNIIAGYSWEFVKRSLAGRIAFSGMTMRANLTKRNSLCSFRRSFVSSVAPKIGPSGGDLDNNLLENNTVPHFVSPNKQWGLKFTAPNDMPIVAPYDTVTWKAELSKWTNIDIWWESNSMRVYYVLARPHKLCYEYIDIKNVWMDPPRGRTR